MGRKAILVLLGMALGAAGFAQGLEITGYVYEDLAPLGGNSGEDRPIPRAEVYLFWDANGTGVLDPGDKGCASTVTDDAGHFSLSPSGCGSDLLFVAVDSRSLVSSRGLEPGYSEDDIWAEETYQSVYDENSRSWPTVKMFGGRDPEVSDDFANEVYEHWVTVDLKVYNEFGRPDLLFGFSFEVIVNTRDVDEDGTSGTGRSAQGTLRQFLENARAISGPDRSYFVFESGHSREILVDPNLWMYGGGHYNSPAHPGYVIADDTILDGRILDWDLQPTGVDVLVNAEGYPSDSLVFLLKGNQSIIENLEIKGNTSTVPDTGIRGIRLSGATYCTVKDLNVHHCHVGLELYWNAQHNTIENVTSHDNSHSGIYFYWVERSHNVYNTVTGCHSYDNKFTGIGLYYDSDDNIIENNEVNGNGWAGIWIGYYCDRNVIQANYAHDNDVSGILISTWPGYAATGNKVIDNLVEGNGGFWGTLPDWGTVVSYDSGIGLYNADGNEIFGNVVRNNYNAGGPVYGIAIDSGSTDNTISGNEITGNGVGIVVLDDASQRNIFTQNSIYSNKGLGIDLGADGVTPNDGVLGSPNRGVDYPVITEARTNPDGTIYVEGFVGPEDTGGSAAFAGATVEIFLVTNGLEGDLERNTYDGKTYGEGWKYLGSLAVGPDGSFSGTVGPLGVPIGPELLLSGTTTLSVAGTSEFGPTLNACHPYDLTGDCALGVDDVRTAHLMARGCIPVDLKADIDGDGDVDMDDARLYAEILLGGD